MAAEKKKKEIVQIIKVQPYPMHCQLYRAEGKPPIICQITHLEQIGFIVRSVGQYYKIGDDLISEFKIPVLNYEIKEIVKVVKTSQSTEAYLTDGPKENVVTVEFHFKKSSDQTKKFIFEFMSEIGQKKKK